MCLVMLVETFTRKDFNFCNVFFAAERLFKDIPAAHVSH